MNQLVKAQRVPSKTRVLLAQPVVFRRNIVNDVWNACDSRLAPLQFSNTNDCATKRTTRPTPLNASASFSSIFDPPMKQVSQSARHRSSFSSFDKYQSPFASQSQMCQTTGDTKLVDSSSIIDPSSSNQTSEIQSSPLSMLSLSTQSPSLFHSQSQSYSHRSQSASFLSLNCSLSANNVNIGGQLHNGQSSLPAPQSPQSPHSPQSPQSPSVRLGANGLSGRAGFTGRSPSSRRRPPSFSLASTGGLHLNTGITGAMHPTRQNSGGSGSTQSFHPQSHFCHRNQTSSQETSILSPLFTPASMELGPFRRTSSKVKPLFRRQVEAKDGSMELYPLESPVFYPEAIFCVPSLSQATHTSSFCTEDVISTTNLAIENGFRDAARSLTDTSHCQGRISESKSGNLPNSSSLRDFFHAMPGGWEKQFPHYSSLSQVSNVNESLLMILKRHVKREKLRQKAFFSVSGAYSAASNEPEDKSILDLAVTNIVTKLSHAPVYWEVMLNRLLYVADVSKLVPLWLLFIGCISAEAVQCIISAINNENEMDISFEALLQNVQVNDQCTRFYSLREAMSHFNRWVRFRFEL